MPPKVKPTVITTTTTTTGVDHEDDDANEESRPQTPLEAMDFTSYEHFGLYVEEIGTIVVLDNERKSEVYTGIGYTCTGVKTVFQAWAPYHKDVFEFMKTNHVTGGQVLLFPPTDHFPANEPAFRSKLLGSYLINTYQAEASIVFALGENEKLNYKNPPKIAGGTMPLFMCLDDWADARPFLLTGPPDDVEKRDLLHPSEWKSLHEAKSSFLPQNFTTVPVKKRTFRELMAMPKDAPNSPSKLLSPIKTEPKSSSSSSSSNSSSQAFSPLFKKI